MNLFSTSSTATTRARRSHHPVLLLALTGIAVSLCAAYAHAADNRKEIKLDVAPGGNVNIVNAAGSVTLYAAPGRQVVISYTTHSDKVEVDQGASASKGRLELRTHALAGQKPTAEEARVDYDIAVPAGISVNVNTVSAPITADGLSGDITLSSETGQLVVRNASKSHIQTRSMTAPVTLSNVTNAKVDIHSSGGAVKLENVSGPRVTVGTGSGNIDYRGDCSGGGDYIMTTHSGAIDMVLPPTASVDLTARSNSGSVENEFPLQEKTHHSFVPQQGRSFAGTSNSGSSSVELQSFSGKIRVKKQ
ncbi:MAG TPA: DUF4097 family beta strand repeat-containing protein [Candidatus Sulfotelmatobacter sp.]|nr:DUF4097 family beta strand repeat-containing protein [Candidatus Sulfotelmatobacter sp.]